MMGTVKPLRFALDLYDRASPGLKKFSQQLSGVQKQINRTRYDFRNAGTGIASAIGSGLALRGLVNPAREMQAAQAEVATLLDSSVREGTLKELTQTAMDFSEEFGRSASDFVRSAYDIQSSIDGLSSRELARFTRSSSLLATATKSDVATITGYLGTMNSVFAREASQMGNEAWVDQFTGLTAGAVRQFQTDGYEMAAAFSNLGSRAANQRISAAEQFSVLGMLQSDMGGSGARAGTAYANFMDNLAAAQTRLGMDFSGDDGRALGIAEIIEQLRSRFGSELSLDVTGEINRAFGTTAGGLIQALWSKTDELNGNITKLARVTDSTIAEDMAAPTVDMWNQFGQAVNNVRVEFGKALNLALRPFINYLIGGAQTVRRWIGLFPNLTKMIAISTVAVIGFSGAIGLLMAIGAVFKIVKAGLMIIGTLGSVFKIATIAVWGFNAGLSVLSALATFLGAPIYLVVLGVAAIIAAIIGLWYKWDSVVAFISKSFEWLMGTRLGMYIQLFRDYWGEATSFLSKVWGDTVDSLLAPFKKAIGKLKNLWGSFMGLFSSDEKVGIDMDEHKADLNAHLPAVERPIAIDGATIASQRTIGNMTNAGHAGGDTHIGSQKVYVESMATPEQMNLHTRLGMPY